MAGFSGYREYLWKLRMKDVFRVEDLPPLLLRFYNSISPEVQAEFRFEYNYAVSCESPVVWFRGFSYSRFK